MLVKDPLKRVLYIDLSKKSFHVVERPDLFDLLIGGTGVATRLLDEECPRGTDPLSADNPIILAVGPLTGMFPLASKTVAMFKSPHTGNLGESHAGGRSAVAIRLAGYGAVVIKGASESPVYLSIYEDQVRFRDARTIWGLSSVTSGRIIRENEPGAGLRTIMRIGRAGEELLPYSNVMIETYRHFGRLGLGAVFGSKKLKAVVIGGRKSLPVVDRREYRTLYDEIYQAAVSSSLMKKYHDLGTPSNVLSLNAQGGFPTRNLQATSFEGAQNLSGESLAEGYLGRRLACAHCPVGCIHIAAVREPYENEPYFYKTTMVPYDYEPIYSMGAMLGVSDTQGFLKLLDKVDDCGLDSMSTGVVLAWATEALEKGLVTTNETMGVELKWGDARTYSKAIDLILDRPNPFYNALARGAGYAASVYGGEEFALTYGNNEMPGYHTGPAAHLGYLFGARHSHLDNGGYGMDQKFDPAAMPSPEELTDKLIQEEAWRQILSSLIVCFFARGIYTPAVVERCLRVAGYDLSEADIMQVGRRIWAEKYAYKIAEGFDLSQEKLPRRIFETASALGQLDEGYMNKAITYASHLIKQAVI